jgi:predicted  nucleic acid-binding Zn-ribbon protein
MKKFIHTSLKISLMLLVVVYFSSCQKYKREIDSLNTSKDSIQQVVEGKNQQILDYVGSLNDIQTNLDSIKRVQKILTVSLHSGEVSQTDKEQILNDIALLNNMINENKKTIESLQYKLKKSNLRNTELEQMVKNYMTQIEEKDAEIVALNSQLEKMKFDISELNTKVSALADESEKKTETIKQQKDEMNVAYYCFGSKDELIANNVIEKAGGFVGLGKTYKMKSDFNKKYFNKVDVREFSQILLAVKKAELITTHPDGTFHFTGTDKKIEDLVIDQQTEFWSASKYLVILVDPK